jgi:hypothetical protein
MRRGKMGALLAGKVVRAIVDPFQSHTNVPFWATQHGLPLLEASTREVIPREVAVPRRSDNLVKMKIAPAVEPIGSTHVFPVN